MTRGIPGCVGVHCRDTADQGKKSRYYYDAEFLRRASIPPPAASDRIAHDWSQWLDHKAVLGTPST